MNKSFQRAQAELSLRYFILTSAIIFFLAAGLAVPYRLRDLQLVDQQVQRQAQWIASSPESVDDPAELVHEFEEIGLVAREPMGVLVYDRSGKIVVEHGILQGMPIHTYRSAGPGAATQTFSVVTEHTGPSTRGPAGSGMRPPDTSGNGGEDHTTLYSEGVLFDLTAPGRPRMRAVVVTPLSPDYSAALVAVDAAASDAKFRSLLLILLASGTVALLLTAILAPRFAATALAPVQESYRRMQQSLADASHELRTPLTAILGEAEVTLRHPRDLDTYRQSLEYCYTYANQMIDVVETVLELSRADARIPIVDLQPVDLSMVVESEVEAMRRRAPDGATIICEAPPGHVVLGDMDQLARVTRNLVQNAQNSTPPTGEIRASVGPGPDRNTVALRITDSGRGIAPEHLPHIFERFYRAKDTDGKGRGSGLGLSIVQAIVEAHHGTVTAESKPGAGATFTVVLPAAQQVRR
ncbi:MAG: HAMP domain-containing histidine kinase [Armatimonadetes bacterium]|nr:HAMP domain-containing histidine kinase [Armatimonadota bacterium]